MQAARALIIAATLVLLPACGVPVELSVAPEVDFGTVPAGGGAQRSLELELGSPGPVGLAVRIEPLGAAFATLAQVPLRLEQGEGATLSLSYTPREADAHAAVLVLEIDDGTRIVRRDVALRGRALASLVDADRDGWALDRDCADGDAAVHPGAVEACDGLDTDCDGAVPGDEADADADGQAACAGDCDDGDPLVFAGASEACDGLDTDCSGAPGDEEADEDGDGYRICDGDCDDLDPGRRPGAIEICDGLDTNCDGVLFADEQDADGDGVAACAECDDSDPARFPGAPELCDGVDQDCDGLVPSDEVDEDGDGSAPCAGDCDDGDASRHPGAAELCNGLDDDCDGALPDEVDGDGDGFLACADCDDGSGDVFPGAVEVCDGLDGDCDGAPGPDEVDADGDGFLACAECDDGSGDVFPGAVEACNGLDDDCDGAAPGELDGDADGALACADCDDDAPESRPGAPELCDGQDNDCDGAVPADEDDVDGDGVAPCAGDCDDGDPAVAPGLPDQCGNVLDDDCDGLTDEGCACPVWVGVPGPACLDAGSFDCPHPDLQAAVDDLGPRSCDEIVLQDGSFDANVLIERDVLIRGLGDREDAVLQGDATASVITVTGVQLTLRSLTVAGGRGVGGGVAADGTELVLDDVVFRDNACRSDGPGGAVFITGATSRIDVSDSRFEDNECAPAGDGVGGALYLDCAEAFIDRTAFVGNTAATAAAVRSGGGSGFHTVVRSSFVANHSSALPGSGLDSDGGALVLEGERHVVSNCLFEANSSLADGAALTLVPRSLVFVTNNVFVHNDSPEGAGVHLLAGVTPVAQIQDNIVAFNDGYGVYTDGSSYGATAVWNDVVDNSSGDWGAAAAVVPVPLNNLSVDPIFVALSDDGDPANDDYHLDSGSPVIDQGNPDPSHHDADGSINDLGLFGGPLGAWPGP